MDENIQLKTSIKTKDELNTAVKNLTKLHFYLHLRHLETWRHGTPKQCHQIGNVISVSLKKKLYCCAVFLEVKQTFDRVSHKGLPFKLKSFFSTPFYLFLNY